MTSILADATMSLIDSSPTKKARRETIKGEIRTIRFLVDELKASKKILQT